jgi:glycosyltransferase involved in cell wall biosynthesis
MDKLQNKNSESFWTWLSRKNDNLVQIVFVFISQLNAQNARNFQLFEASENIRIVYLKGLRLRYSDKFLLKLFRILINSRKKQIANYKVLHLFSIPSFVLNQKQIMHLDDPTYLRSEINKLIDWEKNLVDKKGQPFLICTNSYTKNWFESELKYTKIIIIEQGFRTFKPIEVNQSINFSCVYSSPYIHFGRDKHGNHSTWGAEILIKEIIPRLNKLDPNIEIHLIGEIGKHALFELSRCTNVHIYGRVSFNENTEIISKCKIGIYPRTFDHKRSILKIFSYIGAGLPVVTFDLVDTKVVKDFQLGIAVNSIDEFILGVNTLKTNPEIFERYKANIVDFRPPYSWKNLSNKMNDLISL